MSLLERSVADFLAAVGSEQEPVPAGACSAAMTGALSAALVVLVCRVLLKRRSPPDVGGLLIDAERLVGRLSELIDEDAAAFDAFAAASESERIAALADATRTPLSIALACIDAVG